MSSGKIATLDLSVYQQQKMRPNVVLNAHDVAVLTAFANQGDNRSKLGWDLSRPETWAGIQWTYANNEYHVKSIHISGLELTGHLNLSGMAQLVSVFINNNNLTSVDVSGNHRLLGLYARNAGIRSLNISNATSLAILDCEYNYLSIADIIHYIDVIRTRENAWVSYVNQRLLYNFTLTTPGLTYDTTSNALVLNTVQFSAEGVIPASVFIVVNKFDASDEMMKIGSETVMLSTAGIGIYSLAALPVTIAAGEHVEILVYTDNSRIQLVTRLFVKPIVFEF